MRQEKLDFEGAVNNRIQKNLKMAGKLVEGEREREEKRDEVGKKRGVVRREKERRNFFFRQKTA